MLGTICKNVEAARIVEHLKMEHRMANLQAHGRDHLALGDRGARADTARQHRRDLTISRDESSMRHVDRIGSGLRGALAVCDKLVRPADDPAILHRQNFRPGRYDQITSAVNWKPARSGRAKMRVRRIPVPRYCWDDG